MFTDMSIKLKMALSTILVPLLLFFLLLNDVVLSQEGCGDWTPYKDETCLKIFTSAELLGYEEAESYCADNYEAHLISIGFEEKQKFIESFLSSNKKVIAGDVWIGLKLSTENNDYEWSDGTNYLYSNWLPGSPKNDTSYCVQIHTNEEEFGKWSDVVCERRNVVLCEKLQPWSITQIQNILISVMKNPFPVGTIQVQLPNEKSPAEIWPWMKWQDISSEYAGVFFRVEGGGSDVFGGIQEENAPRLNEVKWIGANGTRNLNAKVEANNQFSDGVYTELFTTAAGPGHSTIAFKVSDGEVRPRNMAIRIWKRIK